MRESLDEPVSVVWYYSAKTRSLKPHIMSWNNQDYKLGPIDFWHKTKSGNTLIHHFSLSGWGAYSSGAQGAVEKRSKSYTEYDARASQTVTQRSGKTSSSVVSSAGEQATGLREPEAYFKLALNTDTLRWTIEEYMTAGDAILEYKRSA